MKRLSVARSVVAVVLVGLALSGCSLRPAAEEPTVPIGRISLPSRPTLYFFGDSWTTGYSADAGRGYPYVVGEALDAKVKLGPDNSGAGYDYTFDSNHPVFPRVAASLGRISADLIVLQGGLNDVDGSRNDYTAEIRATIRSLRQKSGDTPIVMIGPAPFQRDVPQGLFEIDQAEAAAAEQMSVPYISPLQGDWFNTQIVQAFIDKKTFHPTTAGHAYFGGRVASALQRLITQDADVTPSPGLSTESTQ